MAASKKQTSVRSALRKTVRGVAENVAETVITVAADAALEALRARIARVAGAPAHIVTAAGIINGMHPDEINDRIIQTLDAHGL